MSHNSHRPNRNNSHLSFIDSLESRWLLAAATPTLSDGLLTIFGSGGSDHISISRGANDVSRLVINVNSAVTTFSAGSVERIRVNCGKGNDDAIVHQANGRIFQSVTMFGGLGHDTLAGASGRDQLFGGDDNDILAGAGRCDTLDGGNGHDNLFGGARRDLLIGGDGEDLLVGGSGADTCRGGLAGDLIISGSGSDVVEGEQGDDQLRGQSGNDTIRGADGDDDLFGALGIDQLFGGAGNDDFFGFPTEIKDPGGDAGENATEPSTFRSSGI
jgi:Ca2+-binding RTX toxin-like protein